MCPHLSDSLSRVFGYPHPRPAIEQKAAPTNQEPHHARVTPGTNETTLATDLSAQDQSTKDWRAASATKTGPRTASLSEKSSQRGLRIFTNPKSWHVSSRTMRD